MDIVFNPRDNGACPFCTKIEKCLIRQALKSSMAEFKNSRGQGMEIVIYSCPQFVEKF